MAKSRHMLHLERHVSMLRRELSAAKLDAKSARMAKFKATRREHEKHQQYVTQLEDRVLELERYNLELAIESQMARTAWSRLGSELLRILQTPLSTRWYNLMQPVLNWYAVRRLSKDRIRAMNEGLYTGSAYVKLARQYWEHDKEERRNPRTDWKTVVVYKDGVLREIANGISSTYVYYKERASRAVVGYLRRAAAVLGGLTTRKRDEPRSDKQERESAHDGDGAGGAGFGSIDACHHCQSAGARKP